MECLNDSQFFNFIQFVGFDIGFHTASFVELVSEYGSFFWERTSDRVWCPVKDTAL